jgi:signal transduction histidine kinase
LASDSNLELVHDGADAASAASSSQWERGVRLEALANLAHELRSPVQALLGYLDILREEMVDYLPGEHRHVVERMNVNVHDLAQTVENLLEFALADANAEALVEEDCNVSDLLAELSPALEAANAGKNLALEMHVDPAIGRVRLMRRPLKSILVNLAVNAIKFTSKGSVAILAKRVTADDGRAALEVTVNDTGPGIDPTMLAQAFKRCTQLSNSSERLFRGMGLGLAVVKHNVEVLGARLTVTSKPGEGSSFVVTLPLRPSGGDAEHPLLPTLINTQSARTVNGAPKNIPG